MSDVIHLPDPAEAQPETTTKKTRSGSETRRMVLRKPIRFTASELADCAALAEADGKSVEDYLRDEITSPPLERGTGQHVTRRSHTKYLRFKSAEQVAEVESLADRAGLTFGSYVRARALKRSVTLTTRRPPIDRAELARLLALLHLAGSNVNQIARQLNMDGDPDGAQIVDALADLRTAARAILASLGRTAE